MLIEKPLPDGTLTGYGSDYTRFVLAAAAGAPGELVPVLVDAVAGDHLHGIPSDPEGARG